MIKVLIIIFSLLSFYPNFAQDNSILYHSNHKTPFRTFNISSNNSKNVIENLNNYDVKYYGLNLQVSNQNTEISGDATIYAQVQTCPVKTTMIY